MSHFTKVHTSVTGNSSVLPVNSSRGDEGVLIPEQNYCDALLGVLQQKSKMKHLKMILVSSSS